MKQPNSVDPVAWARYNEWRSGAHRITRAARETKARVPAQTVLSSTGNPRVIDSEIHVPPLSLIRDMLENIE